VAVRPKILYLVSSHTSPTQVARLAKRLVGSDPQAHVLIHHDAGSKEPLVAQNSPQHPRIRLYATPLRIEWGTFSIVQSFISTTRWALEHSDFDWLYWISGQHYPIKKAGEIGRELRESEFDAYVESFDILESTNWPPGEGFGRYYYQYFRLPQFRRYYVLPRRIKIGLRNVRNAINRTNGILKIQGGYRKGPSFIGFRALRPPFGEAFRCYGGSQWLTLRRATLTYIHNLLAERPALTRYYKRTFIPDESFLLTLLRNCSSLRLAPSNLLFAHWETEHSSSPRVLTVADIDVLLKSHAHFARKFDLAVDGKVLDALDDHIDS